MRARDGFSMVELVVVILLIGIVAAVAIPNVNRGMGRTRAQRAASVIAGDLQLAHSMAARQRTPVQVVIDTANKIIRVRDFTDNTRIFSTRHFSTRSEIPVQSMAATLTTVTAFPNGLMDNALAITVNVGGQRRRINMTRVGQIRIVNP